MKFDTFHVPLFTFSLAALALLGQGCLGSQSAASPDGGVYRTINSGAAWTQMTVFNQGTKIGSIANLGISSLSQDPQDSKTLYIGSAQDGVLYSLDNGASWALSAGTGGAPIKSIVVDPKNKCVVYAARRNQVLKTENCMRDWKQAYFDPRTDKEITALTIDWFNPQNVYAATSDGDILKSENAGGAWRVAHRVDGSRVNNLAIDSSDSRTVYASLYGRGLVKTADAGASWTEIRKELDAFESARRVNWVALDPNAPGRVYSVSKYGIVLSDDGGATWKALELPTPHGSVDVKVLAVHPKDSRVLVYATDSSIVWSKDGGQTWTPSKLPTSRRPAALMYGMGEGNPLYLGPALPPQR